MPSRWILISLQCLYRKLWKTFCNSMITLKSMLPLLSVSNLMKIWSTKSEAFWKVRTAEYISLSLALVRVPSGLSAMNPLKKMIEWILIGMKMLSLLEPFRYFWSIISSFLYKVLDLFIRQSQFSSAVLTIFSFWFPLPFLLHSLGHLIGCIIPGVLNTW